MSERIILDEAAIQRTITRIAHEILEYNKGTKDLVLLGIKTRGAFLAHRIPVSYTHLTLPTKA